MASLSLNTKLVIVLISISGSAIAGLTLISIDIMQQSLKKDASLRLNVIATDRIQTLKNVWNLRLQQVETLAQDTDVKSLLSASQHNSDPSSLNAKIKEGLMKDFTRLTLDRDEEIYDLLLADANGQIILSQDSSKEGQSISQSSTFIEGKFRAHYNIEFDAEGKKAMLVAVAPVSEVSSENNLGVVIVMRDINAANNILTDKRFLGDTGEIYLVNEDGLIITDSRFVKNARYQTVVNSLPVSTCFGREGADINGALYTNYRNAVVFGASQCESNIGIVLLSEMENSELFEPILTLQREYSVIATAIVMGSSGIAFVLAMSILKPLQKLRNVMRKVQEGEFTKTDIVRRDEIGDLAKSFNSMVEEIAIRSKRLHLKNDILSFMSSRLEVQAQELVKADREKEEFASIIAHESKLVLVPIIGYSDLLLDGTLGELEQKQKEKIQVIVERAWSLLTLTQNILDARRLESGDLKMNMQSGVSIEVLVDECVGKVKPVIESQGHKLILRVEAKQRSLYCDHQRVLQVLDNIISNAIKFSCPGKQNIIELTVGTKDNQIIFSVKDNGIGISKESQRDLFKKFYRGDNSFTRKQGISLGLTISKSIVEAHGGKIFVESDGVEGRGSTFMFSIPLAVKNSLAHKIGGGLKS